MHNAQGTMLKAEWAGGWMHDEGSFECLFNLAKIFQPRKHWFFQQILCETHGI
jgi:hypothetical protein